MARKKRILVLLGPNLNLLGRREPHLYGTSTMADIRAMCRKKGRALHFSVDFRQSNDESRLVGWIQKALDKTDGIIINAASYTHTSLAIHDALKMHACPVVEVHHSDPEARESFRHFSYIAPLAACVIKGRGPEGYPAAFDFLADTLLDTPRNAAP